MRKSYAGLFGLGLVGVLAGLALVLHYRHQAGLYRARWRTAADSGRPTARPASEPADSGRPFRADPEVRDAPAAGELDALRQRIRLLEKELAESRLRREQPPGDRPDPDRGERPRPAWSNRLEELRTSDPELYEDIQRRREDSRRRTQEAFARKAAYLLDRDTGRLNEEEKARHELMVSLLAETWKLSEQMRGLPPEERRPLSQNLRDKVRLLEPLLLEERRRTFAELGRQLGYTGSEADAFADHLNEMVDLTTLRNVYRGALGPWGGPGGDRRPGAP